MKKFIAAILAVIMVLSLAACGGPKAPTIELESNTGYDYMEIYISPTSETSWGDDLLNGSVISRGDSAQIQLAPSENNAYDMRIVDEDGDYWVFRNFVVSDGARVIVSGSSMEVVANNRSTTFDGELQMQNNTAAPETTPVTPSAPSTAGTIRVNLANQTGDDFTYCYMSPSTDDSWGSDLFVSSTSDIVIFRDGQTGYIDIPGNGGSYDLKLADNSTDFVAWAGLEVRNGSTIVITVIDGQWAAVVDGSAFAAVQAQGAFATAGTGSAATPSAPTSNGEVRVNILNSSDLEFYYCKCSPSSESSWGSDLFTSSTSDIVVFDPNESGYILLTATNGTYDLRLETSSSVNLAAQWFNLPIHNGSTVVISGNANGLTATVDGHSYTAEIGNRN